MTDSRGVRAERADGGYSGGAAGTLRVVTRLGATDGPIAVGGASTGATTCTEGDSG